MSNNGEVDWAKAAADWAAKKKDGTSANAYNTTPNQSCFPGLMQPLQYQQQAGFVPYGYPPQIMMPGYPPPGAGGLFSGVPVPPYGQMPPFVPMAPPLPMPAAPVVESQKSESATVLPTWLKEAVKVVEGGHKPQDTTMKATEKEDDDQEISGFFLTPPSSPTSPSPDAAKDISKEASEETQVVKKKVTEVLLKVTEDILKEVATEVMTMWKPPIETSLASSMQTAKPPQPLPVHAPRPFFTIPAHYPPSLPFTSGPAVITRGPVSMPSMPGPHLNLPVGVHIGLPTINPIPPPVDDSTEEGGVADHRAEEDNGVLPFVNPDQPTKGLFRPPNEAVIIPNDDKVDDESLISDGLLVKCVCYSFNGKKLGEMRLNGRKCIIFGSSPKQAHMLDSHTSVYSQHVSLVALKKTTKPDSACALYLIPCGGSTKILKLEQVSFLKEPQIEAPHTEPQQNDEAVSAPVPETYEIINEGDKKREIELGSQIYFQIGSSKRIYLIDSTFWSKTVYFKSSFVSSFPKEEEEIDIKKDDKDETMEAKTTRTESKQRSSSPITHRSRYSSRSRERHYKRESHSRAYKSSRQSRRDHRDMQHYDKRRRRTPSPTTTDEDSRRDNRRERRDKRSRMV